MLRHPLPTPQRLPGRGRQCICTGVEWQPKAQRGFGARPAQQPLHLGELFRPPAQPAGAQQVQQAYLDELVGAGPDLLGL